MAHSRQYQHTVTTMSTNEEGRAPICPFCGVTALPGDAGHVLDPRFICENPDCEAFGEEIRVD